MAKTIMFVDDDSVYVEVVRRVLRDLEEVEGFLPAYDGAHALRLIIELLEAGDPMPEVVFVDINMPVLDGFGFLSRFAKLREGHPELNKIQRVVMLTSVSYRQAGKERGFRRSPIGSHACTTASASRPVRPHHDQPPSENPRWQRN